MKPEELLALTAAPIYAALIADTSQTIRERYDADFRQHAIDMARTLIADAERAIPPELRR